MELLFNGQFNLIIFFDVRKIRLLFNLIHSFANPEKEKKKRETPSILIVEILKVFF